jgi:hypothetical protein
MKFNINLATQPYEDTRRFFLLWAAVLLVMVALTAGLVYGAFLGWRHARAMGQRVAAEKTTLDKLTRQEQADIAILNKAENRDVRERSQVLNGLIRQKEFSWTQIFDDLEHIMPARLHVLSIKPKVDSGAEIEIQMTVAGDSRDKAIELVHNMEQSRDFRHAQILAETSMHAQTGGSQPADTVQFQISAQFVPPPPGAPTPPPAAPEGSGK